MPTRPLGGTMRNEMGLLVPIGNGVAVPDDRIPLSKLVPSSAASRLIGRTSASAGDWQEITLGSGLTMTGTTLSASGGGGISDGDTLSTGLTFPNTGLHLLDTNASHDLIIAPGSDLSADRTLTVTTGDADRTLTLSGNTTLGGGSHSGTNTGDETAAGILAKLVTVDGAGSGLDADLLDGQSSAAFQGVDATLTALAAYNTNGLVTQTAADTFAGRTITGTANEISVADGDGVSGNPTLSLPATIDLGGKTSLEIPNGTSPTVDAAGEIAIDTDADGNLIDQGLIVYHDGVQKMYVPAVDTLPSTDTHALVYDATLDKFKFAAQSGGGLSDGDKGDITVGGSGTTLTIDNDVVTYAKMQNISATSRILGRKTSGSGDTEECTLSEVLDFIGSAAQGDILYRGASSWARLAAGTSGRYLKTLGAGANPTWDTPAGTAETLFNLTDPVNGDFSWVNQGGSSVNVETDGGITFIGAAGGTGSVWEARVRVKTAPSTPYTVMALVIPKWEDVAYTQVGLVFRASGSGLFNVWGPVSNNNFWGLYGYSNVTTLDRVIVNAGARNQWLNYAPYYWIYVTDDGTNRKYGYSMDGINKEEVYSEGRTTDFTANQVGVAIGDYTGTTATTILLRSWAQS